MFPSKMSSQIKLKLEARGDKLKDKEFKIKNLKFKIKVMLGLFFLVIMFSSCSKKNLPLEEKISVKKNISNFRNENKYQYTEDNASTKLNNDTEINLNKNFQTSGRANPFVPLGGTTGGTIGTTAPSSAGGQQIFNANQTQSASSIMPSTLPPLPNQTTQSISAPEVPQWPTQPPILSASPASRLDSMVHLTLRGVIYSKVSGKKLAIIEEAGGMLSAVKNPTTSGAGASGASTSSGAGASGAGASGQIQTITTRSYILQENEVFTEYAIKVVKILPESVKLQRGNQKIILSLKLTPSSDFIPLDVPTVANLQPTGDVVQEGKVSSSMVR